MQAIRSIWGQLPVVPADKFFDFDFAPDKLTYEDKDLFDLWAGKAFDKIDCSITTQGIYFSPFSWTGSQSTLYYMGAVANCYLELPDDELADADETALGSLARTLAGIVRDGRYTRDQQEQILLLIQFVNWCKGKISYLEEGSVSEILNTVMVDASPAPHGHQASPKTWDKE